MSLPTLVSLKQRLAAFEVPEAHIQFRDADALELYLARLHHVERHVIGQSREGRLLYGCRFGRGPMAVSVIAGSHADEPAGPMTAQALAPLLAKFFPEFLDACTFHVIPQMNPDGAERNRVWFSDPADFSRYALQAVREAPGDDIEFGFGEADFTRPECLAAMEFMKSNAPFAVHASLHGMGYAEGAWFLICREWAERTAGMMTELTGLCGEVGLPLHDVERHGEKGFHRIRPGFCSTPTSAGMQAFFEERREAAMAAKFLPNSMEFARSLGGDPLCLVSEMPLFLIGDGSPDLANPVSGAFRETLSSAREEGLPLDTIAQAYSVRPVSFALQMKMQLALLLLGIVQRF
jgi:hypothetical protein